MIEFTYIARAHNSKTGPIPTAYVGQNISDALSSCSGCPLLAEHRCYAWRGSPKLGFGAMALAATHGRSSRSLKGTRAVRSGRYSLNNALDARHPRARAFRLGALGDPARATRRSLWAALRRIRRAGLAVLGYTHFWRDYRNRALARELMASCEGLAMADEAIERGWRPATIVEPETDTATVDTPAGHRLLVCPAQRSDSVQCNDCRLCDPQHSFWTRDVVHGIAFLEH